MSSEPRVIEVPSQFTRREERELPLPWQATPMSMLAVAVQRGMDVATIKDLMDLHQRWEKAEAEKAYNVAFAAFKGETVQIVRNKMVTDGPLKGKAYAELFSVVYAATSALSRHGLAASWKVTKDDKDWIEVTCILKHLQGHSESVSLGGPPDADGAKNAIQARASTVTYLERYTFKAVTGLAERNEDSDGVGSKAVGPAELRVFVKSIETAMNKEAAKAAWREAMRVAEEHNDLAAATVLREALKARLACIDKADK